MRLAVGFGSWSSE